MHHLEDEVGSVVCLWILACLVRHPRRACCTSAGMSGDVWLIFMAASRILTELRPLTFTSGTFLLLSSSSSCWTCDGCLPTIAIALVSGWGETERDSGGWAGGASGSTPGGQRSALDKSALLLQMGQHSFQKTKSETTKRASPQKPTTTARRLTEMSTGNKRKRESKEKEASMWRLERDRVCWGDHKEQRVREKGDEDR